MSYTFSAPNSTALFSYFDLTVSFNGNDALGDGSPQNPFQSISRAVASALLGPRSYWIHKGLHLTGDTPPQQTAFGPSLSPDQGVFLNYANNGSQVAGRLDRGASVPGLPLPHFINSDRIVVQEGIYQDVAATLSSVPSQNSYLSPRGAPPARPQAPPCRLGAPHSVRQRSLPLWGAQGASWRLQPSQAQAR